MSDKPSKNAQILEWLDRAEQHATLGGSARRYALLRYLVNEEIEGRGASIKAYAIARDVMGRPADFDPSTDSIVRVEVVRLRDAVG